MSHVHTPDDSTCVGRISTTSIIRDFLSDKIENIVDERSDLDTSKDRSAVHKSNLISCQ